MALTRPRTIWSDLAVPATSASSFPGFASALAAAVKAAACVCAASLVGVWLAHTAGSLVSPFWPASGVAVGAVLLWGSPALAGIFVGVLAFSVYAGFSGWLLWLGPLGLTTEAGLAAWIVRTTIGKRARLDDLRGILSIVVGAAWLPPLFNAMVFGRNMTMPDGSRFLGDYSEILRFVLANGFGIALITPAMLVWWRTPAAGWWRRFAVVLAATAAVTWLSFALGYPAILLFIPVLAGALTTGLRGTSVIAAMSAVTIVVLSGMGFGPLIGPQGVDYSRVYSMFALLAFGVLPVGAAAGEYRRLLRQRHAAEKAAGLRFWEWSNTDGLRLEGGDAPRQLFHADKERGSLETELGGNDVLSFWQTVTRNADGSPREVAGMLIDASERFQLERTRQTAWQSEVELRNLKASLTPHLLFNCLAAVRGIVRTDPDKARAFIDTLSRFLRDSTDVQNRETILLHEEWRLCEDFLGLQSFRYERELPRLVEIEGPAHHAPIVPMMLLNLVENAGKHGEISQAHPLRVRVQTERGRLIAVVRNHGTLSAAPGGRAGGISTARARLRAVYSDDASLAIDQDGEDVTARLEMPLAVLSGGRQNA